MTPPKQIMYRKPWLLILILVGCASAPSYNVDEVPEQSSLLDGKRIMLRGVLKREALRKFYLFPTIGDAESDNYLRSLDIVFNGNYDLHDQMLAAIAEGGHVCAEVMGEYKHYKEGSVQIGTLRSPHGWLEVKDFNTVPCN